jgi:hypothetical protein
MTNELERHFAINGENGDPASEPVGSRMKEAVGEAAQGVREQVSRNPGTVTGVAVLFGLAGFAIGLAYGQASRRHRLRI